MFIFPSCKHTWGCHFDLHNKVLNIGDHLLRAPRWCPVKMGSVSSMNSIKILYPYKKGVCSLWREFAPSGSKFFPYRADPFSEGVSQSRLFSEGDWCIKANRKSLKLSPLAEMTKNLPSIISSPLDEDVDCGEK